MKKIPKQKVPSAVETYQAQFCFIRRLSKCMQNKKISLRQYQANFSQTSAKMNDATFLSPINFRSVLARLTLRVKGPINCQFHFL